MIYFQISVVVYFEPHSMISRYYISFVVPVKLYIMFNLVLSVKQ